MKTRIINLFGGPSAGKSTTAAQLFGWMKAKRMSVELVTEYAKDVCWNQNYETLDDSIHLFGEQHHRIYRLLDQVEWIVTDSPLFLNMYYVYKNNKKYKGEIFWERAFSSLVLQTVKQHSNHNFIVSRGDRKFLAEGRAHDEETSKGIDKDLFDLIKYHKLKHNTINKYEDIIEILKLDQ